jgi:hypothetical protein
MSDAVELVLNKGHHMTFFVDVFGKSIDEVVVEGVDLTLNKPVFLHQFVN